MYRDVVMVFSSFRNRRRLFHSHPRLMIALVAGLLCGAALPGQWGITAQALLGWNTAVWIYLALMGWQILRGDVHTIRRFAEQEDANAIFTLAVMSFGAVISLAAIVVELASARSVSGQYRALHYLLTATTVIGSWLLVSVMYSFHYANLYYRSQAGDKPLRFPDELPEPGYWDFLYFSFTIGVAAQTADVSVMTTPARKIVLAQSVLSFIFNAAIIGMSINIAAGVIGAS